MAPAFMEARQMGLPITELMKLINNIDAEFEGKEEVELFAKNMALDAYNQYRHTQEEYKKRSVSEFANKYYLACMQRRTIY